MVRRIGEVLGLEAEAAAAAETVARLIQVVARVELHARLPRLDVPRRAVRGRDATPRQMQAGFFELRSPDLFASFGETRGGAGGAKGVGPAACAEGPAIQHEVVVVPFSAAKLLVIGVDARA